MQDVWTGRWNCRACLMRVSGVIINKRVCVRWVLAYTCQHKGDVP